MMKHKHQCFIYHTSFQKQCQQKKKQHLMCRKTERMSEVDLALPHKRMPSIMDTQYIHVYICDMRTKKQYNIKVERLNKCIRYKTLAVTQNSSNR